MADVAINLFRNEATSKRLSNNAANGSKKFRWENIIFRWDKYFEKLKLSN